jgi:RNA polymerase sigma-70 factor (ECF subfamily)
MLTPPPQSRRTSRAPPPRSTSRVHQSYVTDSRAADPHAPADERALFARLAAGDEDAFDAIFRVWYAPLVRIAEGIVRERAVAEEVVPDVLREVWRRRERLGSEEAPRAYLIRSARNRALNHVRHLRVEQRGAPKAAGPAVTGPMGAARLVEAELEAAMHAAVGALPPRCREVFELSRVHGLSYADIGRSLEISIKTVEAQMGKALRLLRERLAPWLPGGDQASDRGGEGG